MNDDFYASIKLVSGEEIFAITSSEEDTLIIQDPVCIESVHGPRGSYLRIEPWMQVPKDQFYFIDKSKIITMTENIIKFSLGINDVNFLFIYFS